MGNLGEPHEDVTLIVDYDGPEGQLVDFFSRLGVWWDREDRHSFGIDHGGIASQREGKHFMAPLARLGVRDDDSGKALFIDPGAWAERRAVGYPWGLAQEGEVDSILLRVTVAYAALDVVAIEVDVVNTGEAPRHLRVALQARTVSGDWNKTVVFREEAGEVIATQTSAPTSRYQIRPEPHIDIVTGWRVDFGIARRHARDGGFSIEGDMFPLPPGATRVFAVSVTAASGDRGTADRLISLVRDRLGAQSGPPHEVIRAARQRWADVFRILPADTLRQRWIDHFHAPPADALTPSLVHRAMMILLRNTIRAQPDQGYGAVMGEIRGTFPCRFSYEGFWVWDCAFQALGFAAWDRRLAKENVLLMLRHQDSGGGLPMLHPDATVPSAQPPLLGWVAMEIYEKERAEDPARARAFLQEVYPKLVRWNGWWFRHRDRNGNGLAEWGNNLESGWDDSPRWDNADGPAGWDNDYGSTRFEAVDLNAYLIKDLRSLGRMAEALDLVEDGRRWAEEANRLAQLVVDVLYDPQDNLFYDTDYATGQRRKLLTPASFLPLWAGVPLPEDRVREMIRAYLLSREHFFGPYPFPTVSYRDPVHDAAGRSGYWRGPIWLNVAYFMIEVLAWHGYKEEAREASRAILKMVGRTGIHENYDAQTGHPGVNARMDFSWSAAMAIAIAMGDLTHAEPPPYRDRSVHLGVRVRDRKVYGRGKDAWIHLANQTRQAVSGTLHFQLPENWAVRVQGSAASPEEGWADAPRELDFRLEPGARDERPVRFVIPEPLDDREYAIRLEAVTAGEGRTVLRLEGPSRASLPWLTAETATAFWGRLHAGDPFRFMQDGREIGRSAPGLVGMLDGRLQFLGRQSLARHIAQRDFIRHALHLLEDVPAAVHLRDALERLLDPGLSPQVADEEGRELLETVVQQTRDAIGG